jgi:predicted metal-dependent hydrolase
MAAKSFEVEGIGTVHVYKRKGAASLRLSIAADGKIRVTVPAWATFSAGLSFAKSRSDWIRQNTPARGGILQHGQHVGKAHRLVFSSSGSGAVRTRLAGSEIRIIRPEGMTITHRDAQLAAHKASIRALRTQAEKLLPGRLRSLAEKYGFSFESVQVKQLKGRWGSCDSKKRITLNLFLMQLPWHLIDYVLVHELTHTKHLDHSKEFWNEFLRHEPKAKVYRTQIRAHKPILETIDTRPLVT